MNLKPHAYVFVLGAVAGLFAGYGLYHPDQPPPERYAAQVIQSDKSVILEKKPQADAKPANQIPKGSKVLRVAKVTVKPKVDHIPEAGKMVDCPPVDIDLTLVTKDDQTSLIASSKNGDIIGGVDIPVINTKPAPEPLKWSIAATYYSNRAYSARVDRDFGPTRVSVEAMKVGSDIVAGVGLGIRF